MKHFIGVTTGVLLGLGLAGGAEAASISIYTAPLDTYQNTANNPCIFYGPGGCPADPAGWPDPASPTNLDFDTLTQTYAGTDYTAWSTVVGSSFIIGLDVNDTNGDQTLTEFTIRFYNLADTLLFEYVFAPPEPVPSLANGSGYADYILAAGCSGVVTPSTGIDACSAYSPFLTPAGTTKVVLTFGYGDPSTGNDGPDKVFAITSTTPPPPLDPAVPEPGSLVLLGSGLALVAHHVRRRYRKPTA